MATRSGRKHAREVREEKAREVANAPKPETDVARAARLARMQAVGLIVR